jgi:hypothetical protein
VLGSQFEVSRASSYRNGPLARRTPIHVNVQAVPVQKGMGILSRFTNKLTRNSPRASQPSDNTPRTLLSSFSLRKPAGSGASFSKPNVTLRPNNFRSVNRSSSTKSRHGTSHICANGNTHSSASDGGSTRSTSSISNGAKASPALPLAPSPRPGAFDLLLHSMVAGRRDAAPSEPPLSQQSTIDSINFLSSLPDDSGADYPSQIPRHTICTSQRILHPQPGPVCPFNSYVSCIQGFSLSEHNPLVSLTSTVTSRCQSEV